MIICALVKHELCIVKCYLCVCCVLPSLPSF